MPRVLGKLLLLLPLLFAIIPMQAQQPVQMASLRPQQQLRWQRTSPTAQQPDGPVLYQLLLNAGGTPNKLARFDSNPRHLTNSLLTDNGSTVAVGGMSISSSGIISFAGGQTFAGTGTVTSVSAGAGLTGGPITISGTLSLDTSFTNNLYPRLAGANLFTTGTQAIQTGAPGTVGLVVQAVNAQTANLQEWRSIMAVPVASVSASGVISGAFSGDGSGLTNLSSSQLVNGGINREQIALLKWYAANQTTTFAVGGGSAGVAFDGASIWVVNLGPNSVSKLRASDGTVLGTFPVGNGPVSLAFDGANIWVADQNSRNVNKLRASDGTVLGTFAVGATINHPGVAFDGTNIWVTNNGDNTVSRLRVSDGATQGGPFPVGVNPFGVAFDGSSIWVANQGGNTVSKLQATSGMVLGTFAVGANPAGVAFDGINIWVANQGDNTVSKLRASDGAPLGTFPVGSGPIAVAFDGSSIWVTNQFGNTVSKLRASDGAPLGTFSVGTFPYGVAFDGANIWVANQFSNTVSKL
ncbi:MAG TPA: hypothetical protein VK738_13760 [Terriglobales bacterium]|nr:hypothetical protein [Terriglobales bacterium]